MQSHDDKTEARQLLRQIISDLAERGGSDFHLRTNRVPFLRVHGTLERNLSGRPVRASVLQEIVALLLAMRTGGGEEPVTLAAFMQVLRKQASVNFSASTETGCDGAEQALPAARLRVHAFIEGNGLALVVRRLCCDIPPLGELGFEQRVQQRLRNLMLAGATAGDNGLLLVAGPVGSGKTTTIGSLINEVNTGAAAHVVRIEDPLELDFGQYSPLNPRSEIYQSLITDREIGIHCDSFRDGLNDALREDFNIIVVGEMRTRETIEACLVACETGHLVVTTLHASGAPDAVSRILAEFPADRKEFICEQLARNLRCVVCQRLIRRADERGRALAYEFMEVTGSVKAALYKRDPAVLRQCLDDSRNGVRFNDVLLRLRDRGDILPADYERCLMRGGEETKGRTG